MKLEAVNPVDTEEICIATVTKVKGSYLWLQLEGKYDLMGERVELGLTFPGVVLVPQSDTEIVINCQTFC